MKNTILSLLAVSCQSIGVLLLSMLFVISGFISCISVTAGPIRAHTKRIDVKPPVDAFAFIIITNKVEPDICLESPDKKKCLKIIKKLPTIVNRGIGSGLLVKAKNQAIVLTAAHVCQNSKLPEVYESKGIKIKLRRTSTIQIRTSKGHIISSKIIKIDNKSDLCALAPEVIYAEPVEWSNKPPEVGDEVFSISAPAGINAPTMNLIFRGFYSGHIQKMHHYTIPTRPGSSGSIVLNKKYQGVGMLNAAYLTMESVGIGSGYFDIKGFLNSI